MSSCMNWRLSVLLFNPCTVKLMSLRHKHISLCAAPALFSCCNLFRFEISKEAVLPSFPRRLVAGDRSSRIHPALLWWLRIHGSLRLQNTSRAQQTGLSLFLHCKSQTTGKTELPRCFYLLVDTAAKGKRRRETG